MKKQILTLAIVALTALASFGQNQFKKQFEAKYKTKLTSCYYFVISNGSIATEQLASMTCDGNVFVKKGYRLLFNEGSSTVTLIDKRTNKIVQRLILNQNKNDKYNTKHGRS